MADNRKTVLTPEVFEALLAHLRDVPNIARACRLLGISTKAVRGKLDREPELRADVDEALAVAIERMEEEVHRRAILGSDRPLVHQGQFTYERDFNAIDPETGQRYPLHLAPVKRDEHGNPVVATIKEYSDPMAMFLLKAHRPEKYRERVDMNVKGELDIAATIAEARRRSTPKSDDGLDDLC